MDSEKSKSKLKLDPTFRRTSISETGKITETEVPLSSLTKEAIDLSAGSKSPTTLFLTRNAAMRITEQAISTALDHAWSKLVVESQSTHSRKFIEKGGTASKHKRQTAEKNTNTKQIPQTKRISKDDDKDKTKPSPQSPPKNIGNEDKAVKQQKIHEKKAEVKLTPVNGTSHASKSKVPQPTKEAKGSSSSPPSSSKKTSKKEEGGSPG